RPPNLHHRGRDPAPDPADGHHASVRLLRGVERRRELRPARGAPPDLAPSDADPGDGPMMNRQVSRLALIALVLMIALIVGTTYWQTWAQAGLADPPDKENQRAAKVPIKRARIPPR